MDLGQRKQGEEKEGLRSSLGASERGVEAGLLLEPRAGRAHATFATPVTPAHLPLAAHEVIGQAAQQTSLSVEHFARVPPI